MPRYHLVRSRHLLLVQHVILFLLCGLLPSSAQSNLFEILPYEYEPSYPEKVHIKAAVFHAPPFAMVDRNDDGSFSYRGFQIDMLESMKGFAALDNVTLEIDMSPAPSVYNEAFDLVANDCTSRKANPSDCYQYDLVVADFWSNGNRAMRVDLSPAWLRTTISTAKYVGGTKRGKDYTTLQQAMQDQVPVCVPEGTYLQKAVQSKYPGMNFYNCDTLDICYDDLKAGKCVLYISDELLILYHSSTDPTIELTREHFNTQYIVWAMSDDLSPMVARLLKRWVYKTVDNQITDELFFKYLQRNKKCPIGTAGKDCDLPCDPNHGTSDPNGVCVCSSTKWTGEDCSIEVPEDLNLIHPGLLVTCYSLVGVNFLMVAFCGFWLFFQRKRAQVKVAQPSFLVLILSGCVISTSTILAMAQEDDAAVHACLAIPWLYSIGFSITFGALFAKILRLFILMKSAAEMRRVQVTLQQTLGIVGIVLVVDVAILVAWTVVDPLQWERTVISEDQLGNALASSGTCASDHWVIFGSIIFSFHFCLMFAACVMCYLTKNIPNRISNGKYVSIAMFSNMQIMIVAIPVLFVVGSDPTISFFVRSIAIWINDFVVLALIFGPLMYNVWIFDGVNSRSQRRLDSAAPIREEIQHYAKKVGESKRMSCEMVDESILELSEKLNVISTTHLSSRHLTPKWASRGARVSFHLNHGNYGDRDTGTSNTTQSTTTPPRSSGRSSVNISAFDESSSEMDMPDESYNSDSPISRPLVLDVNVGPNEFVKQAETPLQEEAGLTKKASFDDCSKQQEDEPAEDQDTHDVVREHQPQEQPSPLSTDTGPSEEFTQEEETRPSDTVAQSQSALSEEEEIPRLSQRHASVRRLAISLPSDSLNDVDDSQSDISSAASCEAYQEDEEDLEENRT